MIQDPNQDETFWNKFGTLGKSKKRAQEVKVVETEGKYAIDSPGMPKSAEMPPEVILHTSTQFDNFAHFYTYDNFAHFYTI